jgi:hypothetical protein
MPIPENAKRATVIHRTAAKTLLGGSATERLFSVIRIAAPKSLEAILETQSARAIKLIHELKSLFGLASM